jgi:hypothetical protein
MCEHIRNIVPFLFLGQGLVVDQFAKMTREKTSWLISRLAGATAASRAA